MAAAKDDKSAMPRWQWLSATGTAGITSVVGLVTYVHATFPDQSQFEEYKAKVESQQKTVQEDVRELKDDVKDPDKKLDIILGRLAPR